MTVKPIKILWQSDSPMLPTGYSCVLNNVLSRLAKDPEFEVIASATNALQGKVIDYVKLEDGTEINFKILPQGKEPYNKDMIIPYINKYKPDIFCVLHDSFMYMHPMTNGKSWFSMLDFPCKTMFYFPTDGEPFPLNCQQILQKVTVPVAMSKHGQKQVKDEFNIDAKHIAHGVDNKVFKPLEEDMESIRKRTECLIVDQNNNLIRYNGLLNNKFVVFSAFRNQGRKMPDRQLKSWAKFAEGKKDVMLFMHTDPLDATAVFDIRVMINKYKLNNSVSFTGLQFHQPFSFEKLNELFNCSNIYFQSTSGEGFGLITAEALCCEKPAIVTDYTTTHEIVTENNAGIAVPVCTDITGTYNVERALMDINKGTEALEFYYNDWKNNESKIIKEHGKNGREACLKHYNWDTIVEHWKTLFREMVE